MSELKNEKNGQNHSDTSTFTIADKNKDIASWYGDETISDEKVEHPYLIDKEHFVMLFKDLAYLRVCLSLYNLNNIDSLLNLHVSRGDIYKIFRKYIKAFESRDMLINIFSTPKEISFNLNKLSKLITEWGDIAEMPLWKNNKNIKKIPLQTVFTIAEKLYLKDIYTAFDVR